MRHGCVLRNNLSHSMPPQHSVLDTQDSPPILVVAGPTGAGKSRLAMQLAEELGGESVNFDSVQIYRGFDIGSAKPGPEERARVPHHLIDIIEAEDEFNAADFAVRARAAIRDITARGGRPILVGGTFFYLRALLAGLPEMPARDEAIRKRLRAAASRPRGPRWLHAWLSKIDPQSGRKIAPADRHRVERALEVWMASGRPISSWERPAGSAAGEIPAIQMGMRMERQALVAALDRRVDAMYAAGLVDETRDLLARHRRDARPFGAIGYAEAVKVVDGALDAAAAAAETKRRTRAYAKRQMTWLRSERNVQWLDATNPAETFAAALRLARG